MTITLYHGTGTPTCRPTTAIDDGAATTATDKVTTIRCMESDGHGDTDEGRWE